MSPSIAVHFDAYHMAYGFRYRDRFGRRFDLLDGNGKPALISEHEIQNAWCGDGPPPEVLQNVVNAIKRGLR